MDEPITVNVTPMQKHVIDTMSKPDAEAQQAALAPADLQEMPDVIKVKFGSTPVT
jgi:hypothetical protein